jgi:hypothetical protein
MVFWQHKVNYLIDLRKELDYASELAFSKLRLNLITIPPALDFLSDRIKALEKFEAASSPTTVEPGFASFQHTTSVASKSRSKSFSLWKSVGPNSQTSVGNIGYSRQVSAVIGGEGVGGELVVNAEANLFKYHDKRKESLLNLPVSVSREVSLGLGGKGEAKFMVNPLTGTYGYRGEASWFVGLRGNRSYHYENQLMDYKLSLSAGLGTGAGVEYGTLWDNGKLKLDFGLQFAGFGVNSELSLDGKALLQITNDALKHGFGK